MIRQLPVTTPTEESVDGGSGKGSDEGRGRSQMFLREVGSHPGQHSHWMGASAVWNGFEYASSSSNQVGGDGTDEAGYGS